MRRGVEWPQEKYGALKALADQGVLGAWHSQDGSLVQFWCNGTVSVTIVKSDEEDPAKNFFGGDRWTGGMIRGSGTVTAFANDEIAVQAMVGTHHWHIDRYPKAGDSRMTLEHLALTAAAKEIRDCRDEW